MKLKHPIGLHPARPMAAERSALASPGSASARGRRAASGRSRWWAAAAAAAAAAPGRSRRKRGGSGFPCDQPRCLPGAGSCRPQEPGAETAESLPTARPAPPPAGGRRRCCPGPWWRRGVDGAARPAPALRPHSTRARPRSPACPRGAFLGLVPEPDRGHRWGRGGGCSSQIQAAPGDRCPPARRPLCVSGGGDSRAPRAAPDRSVSAHLIVETTPPPGPRRRGGLMEGSVGAGGGRKRK